MTPEQIRARIRELEKTSKEYETLRIHLRVQMNAVEDAHAHIEREWIKLSSQLPTYRRRKKDDAK